MSYRIVAVESLERVAYSLLVQAQRLPLHVQLLLQPRPQPTRSSIDSASNIDRTRTDRCHHYDINHTKEKTHDITVVCSKTITRCMQSAESGFGTCLFLVDADGIRRLIRAPCLLPRVTELRCRHSRQRRPLQPAHLTACLPTKRQTLRQPSTKFPEKTPEQVPKFTQPKSLLTSALVSASSSGCWAEGVPPAVVGVLSQLPCVLYSSDRSAPLAERADGALVIGESPALSARTSLFAVGIFGTRRAQIGIRTIP
eukprot:COSAG04_NODE_104_length_26097_cov_12.466074_2_plen_255_part_00